MASLLSTLQERTYELLSRLEEKGEGEEEERKKLVRDFLKEDNLQRVGFELPPLGKDWTWFNVDRSGVVVVVVGLTYLYCCCGCCCCCCCYSSTFVHIQYYTNSRCHKNSL